MVSIAVIDEVIQLAETRAMLYETYLQKYHPSRAFNMTELLSDEKQNYYEYQRYEEAYKALSAYLKSLPFSIIKDLQVLMYIGRDENYMESGIKQFKDLKSSFNKRGWDSKSIEIHQMTEKTPLHRYLSQGKKVLGL